MTTMGDADAKRISDIVRAAINNKRLERATLVDAVITAAKLVAKLKGMAKEQRVQLTTEIVVDLLNQIDMSPIMKTFVDEFVAKELPVLLLNIDFDKLAMTFRQRLCCCCNKPADGGSEVAASTTSTITTTATTAASTSTTTTATTTV